MNLNEQLVTIKRMMNLNEGIFPAKEFSNKTGIIVHTDWELPYDINNLNAFFSNVGQNGVKKFIPQLDSAWKEFVELYPQIQSWLTPTNSNIEKYTQMWHIMYGMASKFNENDIREFLTKKGFQRSPEYNEKMKKLEDRLNAHMYWVPSDKTMDYIEKMAKAKDLMIAENTLLTEASKIKVLVDKVGMNEDAARRLESMCGSLSVWMANKLLEYYTSYNKDPNRDVKGYLNRVFNGTDDMYTMYVTNIMDYIRVGLNSNISTIKDINFLRLVDIASEWHKSLHIGDSAVNYKEDNPIIRDYRKNGVGFYWCDLETRYCDEEAERMGHCGRTGGNTLYSLREYTAPRENHTLNRSWLTAAIGYDGEILQMKGPKNSKPTERFFPYIIDLLIHDKNIKGFGYEYESENDFKITDLDTDQIKKLYAARPDLFKNIRARKMLFKLGIITEPVNTEFTLEFLPYYAHRYVDGAWNVSQITNKDGRKVNRDVFEALLSGDTWEIYEPGRYEGDWQSALNYLCDNKNTQTIGEIIQKMAIDQDYEIESDETLEDLIAALDADEIQDALAFSQGNADSDAYYNYLYELLKENFEFYGEVIQMDDEMVKIKVNMDKFISNNDLDDDVYDQFGDKLDDVLDGIIQDGLLDKPRFNPDDRYTPSANAEYFNEMLSERLSEIKIEEPELATESKKLNNNNMKAKVLTVGQINENIKVKLTEEIKDNEISSLYKKVSEYFNKNFAQDRLNIEIKTDDENNKYVNIQYSAPVDQVTKNKLETDEQALEFIKKRTLTLEKMAKEEFGNFFNSGFTGLKNTFSRSAKYITVQAVGELKITRTIPDRLKHDRDVYSYHSNGRIDNRGNASNYIIKYGKDSINIETISIGLFPAEGNLKETSLPYNSGTGLYNKALMEDQPQ